MGTSHQYEAFYTNNGGIQRALGTDSKQPAVGYSYFSCYVRVYVCEEMEEGEAGARPTAY